MGLDLSTNHRRLRLLTDEQGSMSFLQGDITDTEFVQAVVASEGITHIVHLAALQIPFLQSRSDRRGPGERGGNCERTGSGPGGRQ